MRKVERGKARLPAILHGAEDDPRDDVEESQGVFPYVPEASGVRLERGPPCRELIPSGNHCWLL